MSDTETKQAASKAPTHIAYQVREREGQESIWTRMGAAWQHKDGKGFNIAIDAWPLDGRLTLRVRSEKKE